MNRSRKLYSKALKEAENGNIDKAIDICEEIISDNIKNKAAINLKGLLYYFKGDLKGSKGLWKLNYQVNNDNVSKKYLKDIKEDEKRLYLYISAIGLMRKDNIKDALNLLLKCKESDYNCINVNNAISNCYINLGKYSYAVDYVNKVLDLDRKNKIARDNKSILIKNNVLNNKHKVYNLFKIKPIFIICMIILISVVGFLSVSRLKNLRLTRQNSTKVNNVSLNKNNDNNINDRQKTSHDIEKSVKDTNKKQVISYEKQKIDKADNNTSKHKNDKLEKSDKLSNSKLQSEVNTVKNYSKPKENNNLHDDNSQDNIVKVIYDKGKYELNVNKNYDKAIDYLSEAYTQGSNTYLCSHIIYFLGKSYEEKKDIKNSSKYYIEYYNKFPKGVYEEEVLYRLSMMNKDVDENLAKEYAKKLSDNYPNSMYKNSIIESIINNK